MKLVIIPFPAFYYNHFINLIFIFIRTPHYTCTRYWALKPIVNVSCYKVSLKKECNKPGNKFLTTTFYLEIMINIYFVLYYENTSLLFGTVNLKFYKSLLSLLCRRLIIQAHLLQSVAPPPPKKPSKFTSTSVCKYVQMLCKESDGDAWQKGRNVGNHYGLEMCTQKTLSPSQISKCLQWIKLWRGCITKKKKKKQRISSSFPEYRLGVSKVY